MSRVRLFTVLFASALAATALGTVSIPAQADNIVTNQWYGASFNGLVGTPLIVPAFHPGTNGPILPSGTANAVTAPGTGNLSVVITLPNGGFLTATDMETQGEQFMMDVNGIGATAAVGNPTGLTPGGHQAVGSETSVPGTTGLGCTDDISLCLSTPETSSGTFVLPPGTDTISGTLAAAVGGFGEGSMNFIVEPKPTTVPEPATWLLLSSALLGFGVARRRNRHA